MLDIKFIRENPKVVQAGARKKQVKISIDQLLKLDKERSELIKQIEDLRAAQNKANDEIAKNKDDSKIAQMKAIKAKLAPLEKKLKEIDPAFDKLMFAIPNLPQEDVKEGKNEKENEVLRTWGELTKFDFAPQDYMALAERLDLIDTKRAAKVSGSRFGYLKNEAVLLEFALVQYAFEILRPAGFIPMVPPVMISEKAMQAMGYLEHGGEQEIYHLAKDKLYLVGTSEQSIGPYHLNEILDSKKLPLRYVAFSTCFRREAGSYGEDTKGILRVHQFDKVEMFSFVREENSDREHEFLLNLEEKMMQGLKLPYQVVKMCTGDLGASAARKYDLEAWIPSENRYRETHSTSNCTDFQARRLKVRYKDGVNTKFVHTLNGTMSATNRPLIAILENFQQKDRSIKVPEVLQKYLGGLKKISR